MKNSYIIIILSTSLVLGILLSGMLYSAPTFSVTHYFSEGADNVTVYPSDASISIIPILLIIGLCIFSIGVLIFTKSKINHRRIEIKGNTIDDFKIPILLCIIQVAFTTRLFFLNAESLQSDESILTYTSYLITKGFIPYKDVLLAQTPLSSYIMALFIYFLGPTYPSIRLINLSLFTITIALTYFLSRIVLTENKSRYALAAAAFYAFYPSWFVTISFISTLENVLTLFVLSTAITYILYYKHDEKKYLFFSGFLGGCALATTLRAVYFLLPLVIFHIAYLAWMRKISHLFKEGLSFVSGLSIPIGIMLVYFALNDALQFLYLDVIVYQISLFPKDAFTANLLWYLMNMLPVLLLDGLGVFAVIKATGKKGKISAVFSTFILFSNLLLIVSGIFSQGFFIHYLHYLLPFAFIVAALGILQLKDSLHINPRNRALLGFLVVLIFSIGITGIYTTVATVPYFSQSPYDKVDNYIAQYINNITHPSESIWSSEAAIGFFSNRTIVAPASDFRFIGMFEMMIGFDAGVDKGPEMKGYNNGFVYIDDFIRSWQRNNVSVLVFITNKGWVPYPDTLLWNGYRNQTGVAEYVMKNYDLKEVVTCKSNPYIYYIWVRKV